MFETIVWHALQGDMVAQDPTKVRLLEAAGEEFADKGLSWRGSGRSAIGRGPIWRRSTTTSATRSSSTSTFFARRTAAGSMPRSSSPSRPRSSPAGGPVARLHPSLPGPGARDEPPGRLAAPADDAGNALADGVLGGAGSRGDPAPIRAHEGLMRDICPEADDRRLNALVFSVIGQCLHYKMARASPSG